MMTPAGAAASHVPLATMQKPVDGEAVGPPRPGRDNWQRLELLYRQRAPLLRRRLRRRLGSGEEASDLVHDAFARLLRASAFQSLREPEAFLNRIIRNLLVDRSRRLSGKCLHIAIDDAPEIGSRAEQADRIEAEQMHERYSDALKALPPRTREVFLLHRLDELGYKEIAARLEISVRTVEWHVAEAIVRISEELKTP